MIEYWQDQLRAGWGIDAKLTPLVGEYDQNFSCAASDKSYVLKVMRPGCDTGLIDLQIKALAHINASAPECPVPAVIKARNGAVMVATVDETGADRLCWVMQKLTGYPYADFTPKMPVLLNELGRQTGNLSKALTGFDHSLLDRKFKWNLANAAWIKDHVSCLSDPTRMATITQIIAEYDSIAVDCENLPAVALHNDINDYNILVSQNLNAPAQISGLIDFGDMCKGPRIFELAITAAYAVLDESNPIRALENLVCGFHEAAPLREDEIGLIWPLMRMRMAVSVVNSAIMAKQNPDDPYITISQHPVWRFLEGHRINSDEITARLRRTCQLPVSDSAKRLREWLSSERGQFANILDVDLKHAPLRCLSVDQTSIPENPFCISDIEVKALASPKGANQQFGLGYYGEPRLIYTGADFRLGPHQSSDRRTVHLGVDIFAAAGTQVSAPLDSIVVSVGNRQSRLDYGAVVILQHLTPAGDTFFTLYGHLDPMSISTLSSGDKILKGNIFSELGTDATNGGWAPHLHFQLAIANDATDKVWPGVCGPDDMDFMTQIHPNPAPLLNLEDSVVQYTAISKQQIEADRRCRFASNLKLSYDHPVLLVRGWRHHVFDEWGRPYLDAYNNVPHVGHAHPRIRAVAADQLGRLNTNTRYLHPAQTAFADALCRKLPKELCVCFFVNSGTEANELALRLCRAATGHKGMITPDHGYHGNTTGAMGVSAYKFKATGGDSQPDWVELVELADDYRGRFDRQDPDRAEKYASQIDVGIAKLVGRGIGIAGFIAETFPSVGGQIIPPAGYLARVYSRIHAAGGLCIADEVQTGLGRLGRHFFGFEQQKVVPDIVVLGKPIGNGHPIGVVITTPEIAGSFAQGPEFFSTFGGSILSCRIGREVLDIVDDENLQKNAAAMGTRLLAGLRGLMARHVAIGDVRGLGLFVGVDLVTDRVSREPATDLARHVMNRMRERRILIGREGPADNVLKIRPPLSIDAEGIDLIVATLDHILKETAAIQSVRTRNFDKVTELRAK